MVKVHFLNVGHGDCTIIEHASGRVTVVDINNGDDIDQQTALEIASVTPSRVDDIALRLAKLRNMNRSDILKRAGYTVGLTNPVDFCMRNYRTRGIHRYIQSHPHLDHMRGLAALRKAGFTFRNFWDTFHTFTPNLGSIADREDWEEYVAFRCGKRPSVSVCRYNRGEPQTKIGQRNTVAEDGLHILAPTTDVTRAVNAAKTPNVNNLSYVLWFAWKGVKVVLGGDAEDAVWESIYQKWGANLKCFLLKASHHGRDSGYHQKAVAAMSPQYTIVSVGKKPGKSDASTKYGQYSPNVWSTRWRGHITLTIDDFGKTRVSAQYEDR